MAVIRKKKQLLKQAIVTLIIILMIVLTGCIDSGIQQGKQIKDGLTKLSKEIPNSISQVRSFLGNLSVESSKITPENPEIVHFIANLELIDDDSLDYFEAYHAITDNANTILTILDREGGMDIGFKGTREEYQRVSKIVTKWSPIVENYNNLIYAARAYNETDEDTIKEYYKCLGLFCFEVSIIYTHVWWKPTFAIVGKVYRFSGLNRLAFKCPSVTSAVLSMAHWNLRNYLTDQTTASAEQLIDVLTRSKILPQIQKAFDTK